MYLNLKNHGLDECQDDSDSEKSVSKGAMNPQVFYQISHCCYQSVVDVFATKMNHKLLI